ncbi:hypothetical protein Tco_0154399 [Tanacetum coccineum]
MAVLESCAKHNMVAYLEKTDGNTDFHEIIDFLTRSSIHYALTVSPVVSTTFVEQFWMSAKSKIINNVRYITAKVAGKPVNISEASIRSDLLFDDADGIDSLHNQAIFDAIQLMGYEGDLTVLTFNKALFSPQWRFLFHTMNHCISSKSTSWDQIPTNIATAVICLATNQKYNFSKLIFDGMMRHLDAKKKFVMYPRFIPVFLTNQLKNVPVPLDHFPINALTTKVFSFMVKKGKSFSGNVTPLFPSMLAQPTEDEGAVSERPSETQPTPSPPHPSADQHETQPDPSPRPSPTIPIPDSIPEGSGGNHGGQSSSDRSLSGNEDGLTLQSVYDLCVSLCKQVTTQAAQIKDLKSQIKQLKKKAKPVISHHNAWIKSVSIKKRLARKKSLKKKWMQKESVSKQGRKSAKSTPTAHTDQVFDDVDVNDAMDYMETDAYMQKGVSTEDQVSTVKPDEGTDKPKVSTDKPEVSTAKPKEVEVSTDKLDEGTAEPKDGTSDENLDQGLHHKISTYIEALPKIDPKRHKAKKVLRKKPEARIEADRLLAARLQEEERNERSMLCDLKNKNFEEIQVQYKEVKRSDKNFIAIGSAEDERQMKEMNEESKDPKKKRVVNETPREEDTTKMVVRKRPRPQPDDDSDDEHIKCLRIVTFESTIDSEIMETKSFVSKLHKVSSPDGDYLVVYRVNGHFRAFNYLMEVLHIFDRHDLFHLYDLVMKQYSEITPEGIELILWGDLKIWIDSSTVCILELKDGTVIYMLVERRHPLSKELLQRMVDLGLEVEEESTVALHLVRFIKQQLNNAVNRSEKGLGVG